MSKQKTDIYIDSTGTALENIVASFEEIKNAVNNIHDEPDFLDTENIKLLKTHIDHYQNRHSLILNKDQPLFTSCIELKQKNTTLTVQELNLKTKVAAIKIKPDRRKEFINMLNQTNNNLFVELIKNNPKDEFFIEELNREWIDRSNYAEVQSENFKHIATSFQKMEYYFSELIIKNKSLPAFLKKYKIQIDVIGQAKKMLNFIQFEKVNLSIAMLTRLKLARLGLPDDVILATLESIGKFLKKDLLKNKRLYFFEEVLSSQLRFEFYSYIKSVGNKQNLLMLVSNQN